MLPQIYCKGVFGEHATDSFDDYVMSGALQPHHLQILHQASVLSPKPILGPVHAVHQPIHPYKYGNINHLLSNHIYVNGTK